MNVISSEIISVLKMLNCDRRKHYSIRRYSSCHLKVIRQMTKKNVFFFVIVRLHILIQLDLDSRRKQDSRCLTSFEVDIILNKVLIQMRGMGFEFF